jgi:type II secretory pathway component PulF
VLCGKILSQLIPSAGVFPFVDTAARPAPLNATWVRWTFLPFALFGAALALMIYAANFYFWWVLLPNYEGVAESMEERPWPFTLQNFIACSHFTHTYALLILPLYAGVAIYHIGAMFHRTSARHRNFAWLGLYVLGFVFIVQVGFLAIPDPTGWGMAHWGMSRTPIVHGYHH